MNAGNLFDLRKRGRAALQCCEFGGSERRQNRLQARRTLGMAAAGIVTEAGRVGDEQRCHGTPTSILPFARSLILFAARRGQPRDSVISVTAGMIGGC
jgi:hypothetical protein